MSVRELDIDEGYEAPVGGIRVVDKGEHVLARNRGLELEKQELEKEILGLKAEIRSLKIKVGLREKKDRAKD